MIRKVSGLMFMLFLSLLVLLSGCKGGAGSTQLPPAVSGDSFPMKLTDDRSRQVELNSQPQRLVSLVPGFTEISFALGLGDRLVGVTSYCDYPVEAQSKPKIGGFSNPNLEKIVEAKPDLVLATEIHNQLVESLEALNIKVLIYNPHNVEELTATITAIGTACGEETRARDLNTSLTRRIESVQAKIADIPVEKRPLVFYEVWHEPLMTSGSNTLIKDIITMAGGRCLTAAGKEEYPLISEEFVIEQNPDIMVHSYGQGMNNTPTREVILSRKGWQGINFVKSQRILGVESNLITRPGPRIVEAVEQLAQGFYPERFK